MATQRKTTERAANMLKVLEENGYTISDVIKLIEHVDSLVDDAPASKAKTTKATNKVPSLEIVVTKYLVALGMSPHLKGFNYSRMAIIEVVKQPELGITGSITKVLFPEIAMEFGANVHQVERTIRTAIDATWNNASMNQDLVNKIFGNMISDLKGKPVISMFLSAMADYIRLHEEFE